MNEAKDRQKRRRSVPPSPRNEETPFDLRYPDPYFDFVDDGEIPYPVSRSPEEDVSENFTDDELYWREPEQLWADDMWPWPGQVDAEDTTGHDPSHKG